MANTLSLVFESTTFDVVDQAGQQWLKSGQIAQALGYADETAITKLYARRKDEFTSGMSQTVNLTVQGQMRETRIFSLRGAHLLGMFARTAIAAKFRKWVLDILDTQTAPRPMLVTNTITPAQAQHLKELVQLVVESGKQGHGETWSRLHRKMKVNSYLTLHPSQFEAACQYLRGKFDDTSIAAITQKHFPHLALPAPEMKPIEPTPLPFGVDALCSFINSGLIDRGALLRIADASGMALYIDAGKDQPRGFGQAVADQIDDTLPETDLSIIHLKATQTRWRRALQAAKIDRPVPQRSHFNA